MRLSAIMLMVGMLFLVVPPGAISADEDLALGAKLYKQNCYKCHPSPGKHANAQNIIETMRKPRFRMPKFGPDDISDTEARAIESYIRSFTGK